MLMRLVGLNGWEPSRAVTGAGSRPPVGSPSTEQTSRQADIENARSTALSALHNDRFRSMLAQIGDPGFGDALMRMRPAEDGGQAALGAVQARYAESSE
jgi:hypothetical protein